ncbi:MAG: PIN domain-containing protein [Bacteroidota bacterium]|nr:PIN domain-containing protein [Bacteroidota bacterium]
MAGNKLFLDTNIVLDFLMSRKGELNEIEQIFNLTHKGLLDCFISESVVCNSLYILEKEKRDTLKMLRDVCTILKILPFHSNILHASIEAFKDLEDGLLFFLAQDHKMDFFITRNIKDFKNAPLSLPVFTPKQFIKHLHPNDLPQ